MKLKNNVLYTVFLICVGVVLGTLVAELTKDVSGLSWLSYGLSFGMTEPLVLDLYFMKLTIGLLLNLNVSVILFILASLVIGKLIAKKTVRRRIKMLRRTNGRRATQNGACASDKGYYIWKQSFWLLNLKEEKSCSVWRGSPMRA